MGKPLDLEHLSPAAQKALEGADLELLELWSAPLSSDPIGPALVVGEKFHLTEKRLADYAALGHEHHWPPRAVCRRCGKPSGWSHAELGTDHPQFNCAEGATP
jgi:hypothetical protein